MAITLIEKLQLNLISGQMVVEDGTDWAGNSVILGTDAVSINFKIELINDTTTTLYDNLYGAVADIDPFVSLFSTPVINIPLDADGNVMWGTYKITAIANIVPLSGLGYSVSGVFSYSYAFTLPEMCLTHQVNCISATVTGRDETEYGDLVTTITRENNLYPPPALAPVQGGTQPTFIYNGGTYAMWTGTWTHEVKSTVTYTLAINFTLLVELVATVEFNVECDTSVCKIRCCIEKVGKRWMNALSKNPVEANSIFQTQIAQITWAFQQWVMAQMCGNVDDMAKYLAEIKEISGCKGNCSGCKGDGPQLILPVISGGGGSTVIVDSPNGTVSVIPEIVGTTTTYHLEVAQWILNIINNLNPVAVATDTPTYLTVTPSIILGVKTYTITFLPAAIGIENHIEILGKISRNPLAGAIGQPYYLFTPTTIYATGADVNPPGSFTYVLGKTVPNVLGDPILLQVSGFRLPLLTNEYTVHAQITRKHPTMSVAISQIKDMEIDIPWFDTSVDNLYLRFYNPMNGLTKVLSEIIPNDADIYFSLSIYIKPS